VPQKLPLGGVGRLSTVISAISQREAMDTECCQTSLKSLLERISRLETEVMELRQFLQVQTAHLERPGNAPASLSTTSTVARVGASGAGDSPWWIGTNSSVTPLDWPIGQECWGAYLSGRGPR